MSLPAGRECAETIQRVSKIVRWGRDADFEGTSQQYKLESEIGDILAAICVLLENDVVHLDGLQRAMNDKLAKFREDAAGPKQRLLHAEVPEPNNGGGYNAPWISFLSGRP